MRRGNKGIQQRCGAFVSWLAVKELRLVENLTILHRVKRQSLIGGSHMSLYKLGHISGLMLGIGLSLSLQAAETPIPKFKDYPVNTVYNGAPAPLVMTETAKTFKTRLREALQGKPVFAGEYVQATWGCGTSCGMTTFVNKRTGRVAEDSFGGEFGPYVTDYKLNSRLLVAEGAIMDKDMQDTGKYAVYFYLMQKNGQFKLLEKRLIPRPEDANHDGLPD